MEKLREDFKKIILAGIGAVATTAEKSSEMLDEMVKKGELTVEQGKILNQELKHNIQAAMSSKKAEGEPDDKDKIYEWIKNMSPEQLAMMKELMQKAEESKAAETNKPDDNTAPAEE